MMASAPIVGSRGSSLPRNSVPWLVSSTARQGEFRGRVKTQGSLPSEDATLILLFSLAVSGQIKLRRIDGWRKIAAMLSQHTAVAA